MAMNKLMYRHHGNDYMRVWRDDWAGDQFEVIHPDDFSTLKVLCRRLSIPLEEADDD